MVARLVVEGPDPHIGGFVPGQGGSKRIEGIVGGDFLDRPAGPTAGQRGNVRLVITVINAHGEQLHQFPGVVFVGNVRPVPLARHRIQINDHGGAFRTDLQKVIKSAVRVQQGGPPFLILQVLRLGRYPDLR